MWKHGKFGDIILNRIIEDFIDNMIYAVCGTDENADKQRYAIRDQVRQFRYMVGKWPVDADFEADRYDRNTETFAQERIGYAVGILRRG